jgi:hypothetical protein
MTALYSSVIRLIERTIQSPVEGFSSAVFPGRDADWPRQGKYFSLQKDSGPIIIYPWFGMYDTAMGPSIYIGFHGRAGWCEPVYEPAVAAKPAAGKNYRKPYVDVLRQELCFPMNEEQLAKLETVTQMLIHEKILSDYFIEVINYMGQFL